jgi:hypothetical protein
MLLQIPGNTRIERVKLVPLILGDDFDGFGLQVFKERVAVGEGTRRTTTWRVVVFGGGFPLQRVSAGVEEDLQNFRRNFDVHVFSTFGPAEVEKPFVEPLETVIGGLERRAKCVQKSRHLFEKLVVVFGTGTELAERF